MTAAVVLWLLVGLALSNKEPAPTVVPPLEACPHCGHLQVPVLYCVSCWGAL